MIETRRTVQDGRELIAAPLTDIEIRESNAGTDYFTLTGHAAVFGAVADLGAFQETLLPGSFRDAISSSVVHLLWNHDTNFPLASTDSTPPTLELSEDETGLRVWARIPKALSYAPDLRTLMETGIARGMSFAFTLPSDGSGDSWTRSENPSDVPLRTISRVEALFDVSAVTRGAYSEPEFSMRSVLEGAIEDGRLPDSEVRSEEGTTPDQVAPDESPAGEPETVAIHSEIPAERAGRLAALKPEADHRFRIARARTNHPVKKGN